MDVDNFFDETDVATLQLMSTCIQNEIAELESARLAYDLSAESIDTGVDSVFTVDITFIVCQSIELLNSLEALNRRIAQLEQARSRPEPYRVSHEDQALIKTLVFENAEREVDHAYAVKLQEIINKGTGGSTLSVEQLLDGNTISRLKYKHHKDFETMLVVFDIPSVPGSLMSPSAQRKSKITLGKLAGPLTIKSESHVSANRYDSDNSLPVSSVKGRSVYLLGMPPHPPGVFDLDQTLTEEGVIELSKGVGVARPSSKGKGKGKAMDEDVDMDQQQDDTAASEDLAMQMFQIANAPQCQSRPIAQCGICFDEFRIAENPYLASVSATSSADRNKGLRLPCGHQYCLGCASLYLKTELEKGPGFEWMASCPECPPGDPTRTRFSEEISIRVLGKENMEAWYYRDLQEAVEGVCEGTKDPSFLTHSSPCPAVVLVARCAARIQNVANLSKRLKDQNFKARVHVQVALKGYA